MSIVNADSSALLAVWQNIKTAISSVEATKASINRKYQQLGEGWSDRKYRELGDAVQECNRALNETLKILSQGGKFVCSLARSLQEYDDVNLGGNRSSGATSRHLTAEETNDRWKNVLNNTDELIETYRAEMIAHGAFDGALLTKFLSLQRSQMLQYEGELLNVASGNRPPLNDNEIYHYVIVGENSPYNYSHLVNDFGDFCVQQIDSWVGKINPNPHNDPRRNFNCGQCAAAVYRRINGDDNAVAGLGTYSIHEMNTITGRTQTTMTPAQIEDYLRTQGAGAHVVVGVDRASGAGHWFNAFYDGRQVYTIEGQGGYRDGWPPDYGNVVHWDVSI